MGEGGEEVYLASKVCIVDRHDKTTKKNDENVLARRADKRVAWSVAWLAGTMAAWSEIAWVGRMASEWAVEMVETTAVGLVLALAGCWVDTKAAWKGAMSADMKEAWMAEWWAVAMDASRACWMVARWVPLWGGRWA